MTRVRLAAVISGCVMIIFALLADRIGFSMPGRLGTGQILLSVTGAITVLVGMLGRKVTDLHRSAAIIMLNTALLLSFLELASIGAVRASRLIFKTADPIAAYASLPYYKGQEWSVEFLREQAAYAGQLKRYHPYNLWRAHPFEGQYILVDADGLRRTPGSVCKPNATKVFVFGGSTIWGWGSPDWGTIPAFLQSRLAKLKAREVCVVNFGQDAFVSTQSAIELLAQLQAGNKPDVAVFYDGVNEVFAAYQSGRPFVHADFDAVARTLDKAEHPLLEWYKSTRHVSLLTQWATRIHYGKLAEHSKATASQIKIADQDALAAAVVQKYIGNYRIVKALAAAYGFEFGFFWQPAIAVGEKPLTIEEQKMKSELDPALVNLYQAVYRRVQQEASKHRNLHYVADVLDKEVSQIWIDSWGHVSPLGNKLIAEAMLKAVEDILARSP